ncbi:MAG: toll/interleukin-1 receptor domain-containing protein [Cryomorphaceae bacterium]|nr:toll/interleukin-1 receptor domain-containing protein [Cryomorphaceae bacterium]
MNYKSPLNIYIIWHPNYKDGKEISQFLYTQFCRDYKKPLLRSLGIPVYFRSVPGIDSDSPHTINYEEAEYNAIIPLISDEFCIDKKYMEYIEMITEECSDSNKNKIFPVAINKSAYSFSQILSEINFIRADKFASLECINNDFFPYLKTSILHELCRILLNMSSAIDEKESLYSSPAPVKLFISHSKHDDTKNEALKFRDFINSNTQLKTFFDANDIAYGSNFGEEIKRSVKDSALVVFQSDSYSEREWCRIEVLTAKSLGCPVVIVNAVQNGEKRTFPYMGNYPSIRLCDNNFADIVCLTLEQVLYNKFTTKMIDNVTDFYKIKADSILSNSPELFTFLQLKEEKTNTEREFHLTIYPDPPLGSEEMDVLNKMDDNFHFITPIALPSILLKNE